MSDPKCYSEALPPIFLHSPLAANKIHGIFKATAIKLRKNSSLLEQAGNYTLIDKDGQCYVNLDIRGFGNFFKKIWDSVKKNCG